jgi:hypothetical protein
VLEEDEMKRLSVSGVIGMLGSAFLLTGACGGSNFTSGDGSGGLAGASQSGGASSGGQSHAGESGATNESGAGGRMSGGGASGGHGVAGSGGSMSVAGAGGSSVAGSGGSMSVAGAGGGHSSAGAGGSGGVAGSSGAAGTSGSAGSGGNSCVNGTVTFKMVPAAGSAPSAFCSQGCTGNWLTVTDSNSKTVVLDRGCGSPDCKTCVGTVCPPIACISQVIPPEGLSRPWDETQWNPSVCGAASVACSLDQCVPAGKYKAKMCVAKNTMQSANYCTPGDTPVCTTVDFVLPGAMTVQGTIGG